MPDSCNHIKQKPQFFQTFANQDRVETLMSPWDGIHARELQNKQDRPPTLPVWPVNWIANMANPAKDMKPVGPRKIVLVCIDPHGGSANSQATVISVVTERQNGTDHFLVLFFYIHNVNLQVVRRGPW